MKRTEEWIVCQDDAGRRYFVQVFVHFGDDGSLGVRECWLVSGPSFRLINVVEPMTVFKVVGEGTIGRRVTATIPDLLFPPL